MAIEWIYGLAGGALIGLAGAALLLGAGRVLGVSGIAAGLAQAPGSARWRESAAFIAALIGAPLLYGLVRGAPEIAVTSSTALLLIAGLLVGFGTRLGNGCTSGHGVCGVSRLSRRSLAATAVFMGVAIATLAVARALGLGAPA